MKMNESIQWQVIDRGQNGKIWSWKTRRKFPDLIELEEYRETYNRQRICNDGNALRIVGMRSIFTSINSKECREECDWKEHKDRIDLFKLHVFKFDGICHCSLVEFDDVITNDIRIQYSKSVQSEFVLCVEAKSRWRRLSSWPRKFVNIGRSHVEWRIITFYQRRKTWTNETDGEWSTFKCCFSIDASRKWILVQFSNQIDRRRSIEKTTKKKKTRWSLMLTEISPTILRKSLYEIHIMQNKSFQPAMTKNKKYSQMILRRFIGISLRSLTQIFIFLFIYTIEKFVEVNCLVGKIVCENFINTKIKHIIGR